MEEKKKPSARCQPFFGEELAVVNIGVKTFYEDIRKQNIKVVHVDWKPPAGGDLKITALLDKLK